MLGGYRANVFIIPSLLQIDEHITKLTANHLNAPKQKEAPPAGNPTGGARFVSQKT
jgi:hypothetical protein